MRRKNVKKANTHQKAGKRSINMVDYIVGCVGWRVDI